MNVSSVERVDNLCRKRLTEHGQKRLSSRLGWTSLNQKITVTKDFGYGFVMFGSFPDTPDTCLVWPAPASTIGHGYASREYLSSEHSAGFVHNFEAKAMRLDHPIWGAHIRCAEAGNPTAQYVVQVQSFYAEYAKGMALDLVEQATMRLPGVAVCFSSPEGLTQIQHGITEVYQ